MIQWRIKTHNPKFILWFQPLRRGASPAGTTVQTTINTNQANNEEVRVYAIQVDIQGDNFAALSPLTGANCDFSLTIEFTQQCSFANH